ncbi:MAG: tRNA lysidine(34) synthetase TilS [Candidatus Omnitrophica bacterium]|nr:tRNA lysidine(34) synthetase TilS [Candidatus Omnitrophota bacterium]
MSFDIHVKNFIQAHRLIKKGDVVLIGISGGADSVALTLVLHKFQYLLGFQLHLMYFNHHMAGESKRDEKFIRKLAQTLNLSLTVGEWTRKTISRNISEESAREARFKFFRQVYKQKKADSIALGHHQDDLAETVLMRIIRGSGSAGVRGILPKREIYGCQFIRPLLNVSRREIEQYLKDNKTPFCTDITNFKTDFFRNKIRLELLPLLRKTYNPDIASVLINFSQVLTTDYDYIAQQAQKQFARLAKISDSRVSFNIRSFFRLHPALQRMMVRLAYDKLKGDTRSLEFKHLEAVIQWAQHGQADESLIKLPHNIVAQRFAQQLIIKMMAADVKIVLHQKSLKL